MSWASTLRAFAVGCIPPILLPLVRSVRARIGGQSGPPEWEYVADGWAARAPAVRGWDVPSVGELQRRRWTELRDRLFLTADPVADGVAVHNTLLTFAFVLARASEQRHRLSMLDWGGGAGQYRLLASTLLPDLALDYVCKETPTLCRLGRELLSDARFEPDDAVALGRTYDLVVASSSAHYAEDWRELISRLCQSAGRYLFITRTPIIESARSFVVLQRPYAYGYRTEYLCWFLNRGELVGHVENQGFELIREFLVDEHPFVLGAPEQCRYRGVLFARSPAKSGSPSCSAPAT